MSPFPAELPRCWERQSQSAEYTAALCPNFSGRYEGIGELIEGDATARQAARKRRLSNVFPFQDTRQAQEVLNASQASDGRYLPPTCVKVRMTERLATLDLRYENGKSIEYVSSFEDKARFVCTGANGVVSWGGPI